MGNFMDKYSIEKSESEKQLEKNTSNARIKRSIIENMRAGDDTIKLSDDEFLVLTKLVIESDIQGQLEEFMDGAYYGSITLDGIVRLLMKSSKEPKVQSIANKIQKASTQKNLEMKALYSGKSHDELRKAGVPHIKKPNGDIDFITEMKIISDQIDHFVIMESGNFYIEGESGEDLER